MDQRTRHYIYNILIALVPLLVAAGFIVPDEAQLWLTLAAAVLGLAGTGLAQPNSDPKKVTVSRGRHLANDRD